MMKLMQLLLLFAAVSLSPAPAAVHAAGAQPSAAQVCEIDKGACSKKSGDVAVTLDIRPKPVKAMQELDFSVTLNGAREYDSLKLDLQMVGMHMGSNVVTLVKTAAGRYSGKGVIPRCRSGKKLWSAALAIPGHAAQTAFLFNVVH